MRRSWLEVTLAVLLLAAISALTTAYVTRSGWTLYYGDAEAHLDIARRIVDSRTPGYDQIGTVWLPLPHILMLPFVRDGSLWRSGLAGAVPSSVCYVLAGAFLFAAMRRATRSSAAAFVSMGILALNPNLLYLQATPMTETVVLAALLSLLYLTIVFGDTHSYLAVAAAGVACLAASLARYEGWFVIPFVALYFAIVARRWQRVLAPLLFCAIAVLGPLYWLAHNWWLYSNPLEFYNGPYSPAAIYHRALAQNMARYPGDHDWRAAAVYFSTAVRLFAGPVTVGIGLAGIAAAFWKRTFWPVLFAALPPVFYVWSMHSGSTPIFVPTLWPFSYYNTRYALTALPLLAIGGGMLVLLAPSRWRAWIAPLIVLAATLPWLIRPQPSDSVVWKEAQVNSATRRVWTKAAANYLAGVYHPGDGIITTFGELTGIFRSANIPLQETLFNGNEPMWIAGTTRPDLFLHEEWALTASGDAVATAIQRSSLKAGPHYHLVQTVKVKGAPVIEIYKRD